MAVPRSDNSSRLVAQQTAVGTFFSSNNTNNASDRNSPTSSYIRVTPITGIHGVINSQNWINRNHLLLNNTATCHFILDILFLYLEEGVFSAQFYQVRRFYFIWYYLIALEPRTKGSTCGKPGHRWWRWINLRSLGVKDFKVSSHSVITCASFFQIWNVPTCVNRTHVNKLRITDLRK